MPRPRIHDQASGEALLEAARDLLRSGGPAAVSVRSVADACGVSTRAVYAVFGSKQALIDALAERGYRELADRVRAVPTTSDPARDLVVAGVEGFRAFALQDPEMFRLTFEQVSAEVLGQKRVARAARDAYEALVDRIRRVRAAGGVHPQRSVAACAFAFHSLGQGLASAELSAREPPAGPGFWPMVRTMDMVDVWRDAARGLVTQFAVAPDADT